MCFIKCVSLLMCQLTSPCVPLPPFCPVQHTSAQNTTRMSQHKVTVLYRTRLSSAEQHAMKLYVAWRTSSIYSTRRWAAIFTGNTWTVQTTTETLANRKLLYVPGIETGLSTSHPGHCTDWATPTPYVIWLVYSSGIQPGVRVPPGVCEDILGGT